MSCDWDVDWLGNRTKFDDMCFERRVPAQILARKKKTGKLKEMTVRLREWVGHLWTLPFCLCGMSYATRAVGLADGK